MIHYRGAARCNPHQLTKALSPGGLRRLGRRVKDGLA